MATRSLNKVQLIGNLTRDPELRYTSQGTAVCSFGLATNRSWVTDTGERREETEFHRIVAWNKLAEVCSQFLFKGRKVFVEGRIQTRQWTAQDGTPRQTTEIIINDMIILDSRRASGEEGAEPAAAAGATGSTSSGASTDEPEEEKATEPVKASGEKKPAKEEKQTSSSAAGNKTQAADDQKSSKDEETEIEAGDIPF